MVQKYQNEIPPIFYYGISTKTNEKDLKIPNLQALTLGRIIKMTLYDEINQRTMQEGQHIKTLAQLHKKLAQEIFLKSPKKVTFCQARCSFWE